MEKYSVLMPVYIRENAEYFRQAVDSMFNQTVQPDEFVLVCDGPLTEELEQVIAWNEHAHPDVFRVIRLPENRGLGVALQIGLEQCKNDLVARMDSDDISLPDRLEKQLKVMEDKTISVVGGQIAEFEDTPENIVGYRVVPQSSEEIYRFAKYRCPVNHMTVLMRRTDVLAVGGYQHFPSHEDYFLWIRLIEAGYRFVNVPEICCHVRVNRFFYQRRGGWDYFVKAYRLQQTLLQKRLINRLEFAGNVALRLVGAVLITPGMRGSVVNKILRKGKLDQESKAGAVR